MLDSQDSPAEAMRSLVLSVAWGTHKKDLHPTGSCLFSVGDQSPSTLDPFASDLETPSHASAFPYPRD